MATPWKRRASLCMGWLADRKIPTPLRGLVYGGYCRVTGADPAEAQLEPRAYPSLGAFFVRRLAPGARAWDPDPGTLPSPCDGTVQDVRRVAAGTLLQAKGHEYALAELLGDAAAAAAFEGGWAWTIYLSPRDYHRVHAPEAGTLTDVRWLADARHSVAPRVLARRARVFVDNERAALFLSGARTRYALVMVGALNVGRIQVVGVERGSDPAPGSGTGSDELRAFERGDELARFELGSTIVLLLPAGTATPLDGLAPGHAVRLGSAIGRFEGATAG